MVEEKIASLAKDLLTALETQQLELKRVVDIHQEALDMVYGASMMSSWTHSLSPSRQPSMRGISSPPEPEANDEWQSSLEQDAGLSLYSDLADAPEQLPEVSGATVMPKASTRASQMGYSYSEMLTQSNSQDLAKLDVAVGFVVVANTLEMAFELECRGHAVGTAVGIPDGMQCDDVGPTFLVLNHCFNLVYMAELAIRLWHLRSGFFSQCANWFDMLLVIVGCVDVYILSPLSASNGQLIQLVRIFKLARVGRLARTFRLFPGLRLLMHACTSFLPALGWSMVLLGLCITMGGLSMGTLLQDFILDESKPLSDRMWIWLHYGTSYRAMYTLYEITFAGSWPNYARPVLENVSHIYVLFYITYITFIVFAVIRVISAVFLSQTLEAANNDAEMMIQDRLTKKAKFVQKLEGVFRAMDESGDGLLSEDEMTDLLEDPKVQAYLESLEVAVPESKALFRLLQSSDGQVTYEDFIEGILRCKGPARAMDQIVMQAELRSMQASVTQVLESLEDAKIIVHSRRCRSRGRKPTKTRLADGIMLMQASTAVGRPGRRKD